MNTIQLMTCWLNTHNSAAYNRHISWLTYMDKLKGKLEFSDIWFLDNASDINLLTNLGGEVLDVNFKTLVESTTRPYLRIVRFEEHLPRISTWDYPYVFRAFKFFPSVIRRTNPDKVLFIDTDFYPLTQKMVDKLNSVNSGFLAAKDDKYGFREMALSVLAKDGFPMFFDFCEKTNFDELKLKGTIEEFIPFTGEIMDINGGRYGEANMIQTKEMDYYGQNSGQPMIFGLE